MSDKILHFINVWLSRSGDDTFWSWVITFTYLVTVILSFAHVKRIKDNPPLRFLWLFISVFVLLMGINKQLDVQILLGMIGRFCTAHLGLREYRYQIYFLFLQGIFLLMLIGAVILFVKTRSVIMHSKLPLAGILTLMLFIFIRAGYIYVPRVHGIELAGLLMILAGLFLSWRKARERKEL